MRSVFRHHRRMMVPTSNQIASQNLTPINLYILFRINRNKKTALKNLIYCHAGTILQKKL